MRILLLALLLCPLQSCVTKYQKYIYVNTGGFSEEKIKENHYIVQYNVNGYTDFNRAIDFALLRASEISLNNKKQYFHAIPYHYKSATLVDRYSKASQNQYKIVKIKVELLDASKNKKSPIFSALKTYNILLGRYSENDLSHKFDCAKVDDSKIRKSDVNKVDNFQNLFIKKINPLHGKKLIYKDDAIIAVD